MKKLIRDAGIYFALGMGCIIGADYVGISIWTNVLLISGGVFLGVLAAALTLIEIQLKAKEKEKASEIEQ
jgi:hypothetical protein